MIYFFDRDGNELTNEEWEHLYSNYEYKRVAATKVGDYFVSTVWLGMDHSFGHGVPTIFETMIFFESEDQLEPSGDVTGYDMHRYETEFEALEGHRVAVEAALATYESRGEEPLVVAGMDL